MATINAINNTQTGGTLITPTITSPIIQGSVDGWIGANETWTYASASTFTVSGDVSSKYQKGDKIKWTQTTVKYGYVLSAVYGAPNTTITIAVNTDYVIANAVISNNYYSRVETPMGFPDFFNYTATLTGFSADPANAVYRFNIKGRTCTTIIMQTSTGTSNTTGFTITAPVSALSLANTLWVSSGGLFYDNGAVSTTEDGTNLGLGTGGGSLTIFILQKGWSTTGWTNSGGKAANFTIIYEI